jgi:hypothetical protein
MQISFMQNKLDEKGSHMFFQFQIKANLSEHR